MVARQKIFEVPLNIFRSRYSFQNKRSIKIDFVVVKIKSVEADYYVFLFLFRSKCIGFSLVREDFDSIVQKLFNCIRRPSHKETVSRFNLENAGDTTAIHSVPSSGITNNIMKEAL